MAAPLRFALTALLWSAVGCIYLPLVPALELLVVPALSAGNWLALLGDAQLPQALAATLVSALLALGTALLIVLSAIAALWPSRRWQRLTGRLPLMLALPHVAFATAALLLFAEGGWLYRSFPALAPPVDRYGIGLGLTLGVKESVFLLWAAWSLLGEKQLHQQCLVLRSLGYGRGQCLMWLIAPRLLPGMRIVLLATLAWTLSVVDVAVAIGPGNPPTLAVLAWQWLSRGDELQQAKGSIACLLLLAIMALLALAARLGWRLLRRRTPDFSGLRRPRHCPAAGAALYWLLPLSALLAVITLLRYGSGELPDGHSLSNTLGLGLCSAFIAIPLALLWLEFGPRRRWSWIWLPLLLPALPLVAGQYRLALLSWLDGEWLAVLWGHLLWVLPWTLFILHPAWQQQDPRLRLTARTLGWGRARCFLLITCPQLSRPLLGALAVGFSVSVAQYLPTLWIGAGRITTLTTDAVALSSGGSPSQRAALALWQMLLPLFFFSLVALLIHQLGRYRQGLR